SGRKNTPWSATLVFVVWLNQPRCANTVIALVSLLPPAAAITSVVPSPTADTRPPITVATPGSLDDQSKRTPPTMAPSVSSAVAPSCTLPPTCSVSTGGVTITADSGGGGMTGAVGDLPQPAAKSSAAPDMNHASGRWRKADSSVMGFRGLR